MDCELLNSSVCPPGSQIRVTGRDFSVWRLCCGRVAVFCDPFTRNINANNNVNKKHEYAMLMNSMNISCHDFYLQPFKPSRF